MALDLEDIRAIEGGGLILEFVDGGVRRECAIAPSVADTLLAMLLRLRREEGEVLRVAGGRLILQPPDKPGGPIGLGFRSATLGDIVFDVADADLPGVSQIEAWAAEVRGKV